MTHVDLKKIDELVQNHYLTKRKHPDVDLWILNYTPKCQYEPCWTEETLMCRGLIIDSAGEIIARPFKKFFNLQEHEGDLPNGEYQIHEKMDGSLGILYWIGDQPFLATRGSFESDQAKEGSKILQQYDCSSLDRSKTYLFEIIYPENRIVVDYGGRRQLVLLAIIDTKTGQEEKPFSDVFPVAFQHSGALSDLKQEENAEGFVLRWANGFRLKFKFDEYVRLHRLLTGCTVRSIWDLLRNKQPIDELLDRVPDEFYQWVKTKKEELEQKFLTIKNEAAMFVQIHDLKNLPRRDAAFIILERRPDISAIIFKVLDDREPDDVIWKMLRPAHEIPFKTEI